jgi:hypothetical protein
MVLEGLNRQIGLLACQILANAMLRAGSVVLGPNLYAMVGDHRAEPERC